MMELLRLRKNLLKITGLRFYPAATGNANLLAKILKIARPYFTLRNR